MGKLAPGTYSTYRVLIVQLVLSPIVPFSRSLSLLILYKTLCTECTKIYRKYVLHLLKYTANLYLSRCSTDLRYIVGRTQ